MENKLLKLEIEGHDLTDDLYVEIYNNKIKKIGKINSFIISQNKVNGNDVAIAEITDYYLMLTLNPVKFVDKISKNDILNKLSDRQEFHKFSNIFGG